MIDSPHREPHTTAVTFAFFGAGQVFNFLGQSSNLEVMNQLLSTLSFMISITVGIMTIYRTVKKKGKQ